MRKGGQYIEKVQEELNIYQRFLLEGDIELTETQQKNFDRILDIRDWLREGYSDSAVINMARRCHKIQERRSRELLILTYEVFAELRRSKNSHGVKYIEAEVLDEAAREIREEAQRILNVSNRNEKTVLRSEDYKDYVALMQLWRGLKKDSAQIKGAYEKNSIGEGQKKQKPTKITFVKIENITQKKELDNIIEIEHEEVK